MFRMAAAIAFACTIILTSGPSDARARLRMPSFSSAPKPAAILAKPAAAAPAASRTSTGVGLYIPIGSRPAGAASDGSAQRAVDDPSKGPLQFDPTLAAGDAKPADDKAPTPPKELAAAPSTECVVAKEPAVAKDKDKEVVAEQEPPKAEPTRSRAAFLVPVVNPHRRAPAPQLATICYVQRDGRCTP